MPIPPSWRIGWAVGLRIRHAARRLLLLATMRTGGSGGATSTTDRVHLRLSQLPMAFTASSVVTTSFAMKPKLVMAAA